MKEKKIYEAVEIAVIYLDGRDVITSSDDIELPPINVW